MQSLFRLQSESTTGSIELRQWSYAKDGLMNNVEKIEQFYQAFPVAVDGNHLLVRLIQTVNISRKLAFDRYVANCSSRALSIAQSLKLTSALSKGQIWDGVFYGKDTKEVIIGHDTLFSLQDVYTNWKSMQPVTVLQHNQTNTALMLPDGRLSSTDKGLAFIAINIPMLMAMYYRFNEEQDEVELGGGTRRTLYQFISSYALGGMVRTHLDGVVFNRLYNRLTGVPTTEAIRKHNFFMADYSNALDTSADMQLAYLKNLKVRFSSVMHATHLPVSGNLLEFSQLPSVAPTLQSYWALAASRMKILAFLCLAQSESKRIDNRELTTINKLMAMQQTRQVMRNNMGIEAYYNIAPYLDIAGID